VFRIVQEALTNVARHAQATHVDLALYLDADRCILRIADDGVGAHERADAGRKSFGLVGIRERAHRLNGSVAIQSSVGKGFTRAERSRKSRRRCRSAPRQSAHTKPASLRKCRCRTKRRWSATHCGTSSSTTATTATTDTPEPPDSLRHTILSDRLFKEAPCCHPVRLALNRKLTVSSALSTAR
jgi:hypothetical protein